MTVMQRGGAPDPFGRESKVMAAVLSFFPEDVRIRIMSALRMKNKGQKWVRMAQDPSKTLEQLQRSKFNRGKMAVLSFFPSEWRQLINALLRFLPK